MEKHVCSYERVRAAVPPDLSDQQGALWFLLVLTNSPALCNSIMSSFTNIYLCKLGTAGGTVHRNDLDIKVNRSGNQHRHTGTKWSVAPCEEYDLSYDCAGTPQENPFLT